MARKRNFSLGPLFPNFIAKDDDEYYLPQDDSQTLLHDSFYPGAETQTIRKEPVKGYRVLNTYIYLLLSIFIIFTIRVWFLQIRGNEQFATLAEGRRIALQSVSAQRGVIYDRNKEILVKNIPSFSIAIIRAGLPDDDEVRATMLTSLGEILDMTIDQIEEKLDEAQVNYFTPVNIKENIERQQALFIAAKHLDFPGVIVEEQAIRSYITDPPIPHVLGYVGSINKEEYDASKTEENQYQYGITDKIGKSGIEYFYENILRGEKDIKKIEVNSYGAPVRLIKRAEPIAGNNIVLTIDRKLQKKARELLIEMVEQTEATGGVVIAQDPNNGEILSLVSYPDYDNNLFIGGISSTEYQHLIDPESNKPLFNRAITGLYPPGSVFKPFVASGALQENTITENTSFFAPGFLTIGRQRFVCWIWGQHGSRHGNVNVVQSLEESCDIFYYTISGGYGDFEGMGSDAIVQYADAFGFNNKTGIDLPFEKNGSVPSKLSYEEEGKQWRLGDTYNMAIGQGYVLATPLQIVNATSAIANGGTLFKPTLLKEILSHDETTLIDHDPIILNQNFVDKYNIDIVRKGMQQVVYGDHGTAKILRTLPITVAGKTGTAQYQNNQKEHAWFTAFAPFEDPKISLVVLVEGGGEGSKAAAPIAKELLRMYFSDQE